MFRAVAGVPVEINNYTRQPSAGWVAADPAPTGLRPGVGSKLDVGWSVSVVYCCWFTVIRRCRLMNVEEWMMRPFRIVSVEVNKKADDVESFALGRDARVVIGFDRPLTRLECKRVKDEVAKFVSDEARVSVNGSSLIVRTRDFDSVGEFIDAANASAAEWCADVAAEVERAKAVLLSAAELLGSVVVGRKNRAVF